jgi:hypothetical protein
VLDLDSFFSSVYTPREILREKFGFKIEVEIVPFNFFWIFPFAMQISMYANQSHPYGNLKAKLSEFIHTIRHGKSKVSGRLGPWGGATVCQGLRPRVPSTS